MKQRTAKPTRKVTTASATACLTVIIGYVALRFYQIELPTVVAGAIAGLVVGGCVLVASWLTPPSPDDDPIVAPRHRPTRRARPGSDPLEK